VKCRNCGAELPLGAMFCGECGASVAVPKLVEPATRARPGDTVTITPVARPVKPAPPRAEVEHVAGPEPEHAGQHVARPQAEVEHVAGPEPEVEHETEPVAPAPEIAPTPVQPAPVSAAPVSPVPVRPAPVRPATDRPATDRSARDGSAPEQSTPDPSTPRRDAVSPPAAVPDASVPLAMPPRAPGDPDADRSTPSVSPRSLDDDHQDVEATRIVRGMKGGERFVLQFSTGENAIVFGSGLVGRNPVVEPGEFVDQLIAIVDTGKSVSKTHLEFGQIEGRFWVSDRFSANGTIVRQPDARPQRLEPGRRQQVARGTRIDMGEQFVVVS
jgi:hypothetical protein